MERIAHRGAKREFPENTLEAFARAYERDADAVELDVHATADGVVVVHHDPWIGPNRFTSRINQMSWADLSSVSVGGVARIPTLSAVLAATPAWATVYVEIKGDNIETLVAAAIRASSARCAVHSFNHDAIVRMRDIAPEIPRGILFEQLNINILDIIRVTDARDVWPRHDLLDRDLVAAIRAARARVIAWTVNDPGEAGRLTALGVDGLCGDDVRILPKTFV
jgi:glycerophosphoryl diester phosphodiesterase